MQKLSLKISMIIVMWQMKFVQFTVKKHFYFHLQTQPGIRNPGGFFSSSCISLEKALQNI